jgi:hypothetical protein
MADSKLTELLPLSTLNSSDLLYVVTLRNTPLGESNSVTVNNLFGNITVPVFVDETLTVVNLQTINSTTTESLIVNDFALINNVTSLTGSINELYSDIILAQSANVNVLTSNSLYTTYLSSVSAAHQNVSSEVSYSLVSNNNTLYSNNSLLSSISAINITTNTISADSIFGNITAFNVRINVKPVASPYTVTVGDHGSTLIYNSSASGIILIPNTFNGCAIEVIQQNIGTITLSADVGVTLQSYLSAKVTAGQFATARILQVDNNTINIAGNLL